MIVPHSPKQVHKSTSIPTITGSWPHGYQLYNGSNVLQSEGGPGSVVTSSGLSDIVYTRRPKGDISIHSNYCVHKNNRLWYTGNVSQSQYIKHLTNPGWYTNYWSGHYLGGGNHTAAVSAAKIALGYTVGETFCFANAQAWMNDTASRTKPDLMKFDGFNLATQSAELLDGQVGFLKSLVTPKSLREDYQILYFEWQRNSSLVKNLAGQFLGYRFGLAPDIGDLNAASKGLLGFRAKLDAFKQNCGKLMRTYSPCLTDSIHKSGSLVTNGNNYVYWDATLTKRATAYIYYWIEQITALNKADEDFRAILSTVGLELNPRVAWDAIPFSFVVDWFFNVGKVLERFKIPALELPISYKDAFVQYKQELSISSWYILDVGSGVSAPTTWPSWYTTEKVFCRYPIFPDYTALTGLGFRLPTADQATLLVALGAVLL